MIITSPRDLFESSLLIMFLIPSVEKSTSVSELPVIEGKNYGNMLPLSIMNASDKCVVVKRWWNPEKFSTIYS